MGFTALVLKASESMIANLHSDNYMRKLSIILLQTLKQGFIYLYLNVFLIHRHKTYIFPGKEIVRLDI